MVENHLFPRYSLLCTSFLPRNYLHLQTEQPHTDPLPLYTIKGNSEAGFGSLGGRVCGSVFSLQSPTIWPTDKMSHHMTSCSVKLLIISQCFVFFVFFSEEPGTTWVPKEKETRKVSALFESFKEVAFWHTERNMQVYVTDIGRVWDFFANRSPLPCRHLI